MEKSVVHIVWFLVGIICIIMLVPAFEEDDVIEFCGLSASNGSIIYKYQGTWDCLQLGNATSYHNITTLNTYINGSLDMNRNPIYNVSNITFHKDDDVNIGFNTTATSPVGTCTAIGSNAYCTGNGAVSLGDDTHTDGAGSAIAIGRLAESRGDGTVAIGGAAFANDTGGSSVDYGVCIGFSCFINSLYSIAIGWDSKVTATHGVAIGNAAHANATNSIAIGYGVINNVPNSVKIGQDSVLIHSDGRINASDNITTMNHFCLKDDCVDSWSDLNSSLDIWVNETGDTMTGQLIVKAGNGNIVSSNSAGGIDVQTGAGEAGSISFGNTADIGVSRDGLVGDYDYDGAFIFKQKTSNPTEIGEFIWIEENGNWRFALPSSGADYGTYNPRSMIIAGASRNNASNFKCSYWNFTALDCATDVTGADLGVQDDFQVLGSAYVDEILNVTEEICLGGTDQDDEPCKKQWYFYNNSLGAGRLSNHMIGQINYNVSEGPVKYFSSTNYIEARFFAEADVDENTWGRFYVDSSKTMFNSHSTLPLQLWAGDGSYIFGDATESDSPMLNFYTSSNDGQLQWDRSNDWFDVYDDIYMGAGECIYLGGNCVSDWLQVNQTNNISKYWNKTNGVVTTASDVNISGNTVTHGNLTIINSSLCEWKRYVDVKDGSLVFRPSAGC